MSDVYVQFTDDSETTVCSVYASPQNPIDHPNRGVIDSSDARYQAFIKPPPPPLTCTPYQFRAALTLECIRDEVEEAVASSESQSIKDAYGFAQVFVENDAFIMQMAEKIGQTSEQVHALFVLAQTLQA